MPGLTDPMRDKGTVEAFEKCQPLLLLARVSREYGAYIPGNPAPTAAQRLARFFWQFATSQHVWPIPLTLGRALATAGQASGRRQAGKLVRTGLYTRTWEE